MNRNAPLVLLSIALFSSATATAAIIERLDVRQRDAEFSIELDAVLNVPLMHVWAVLTDYAKFHVLSPSVKESDVVRQVSPTTHRVWTRSRVCVLIFCKELHQVQTLEQRRTGELVILVDPDVSDFEFGYARWFLVEEQGITRVQFETRLRPAFWVPPLIGPWAIKRAMRKEAQATCSMLERLANLDASS